MISNNATTVPLANTVSQEITTKLLRRIVDGVYPAGGRLPNERGMAEEFGVTRNVVREALKRIEAMGMVSIRQGSGCHVEELQTKGGIELVDLFLFRRDGSMDEEFLDEIIQFHEDIHISVVKLAAQNITREEIEKFRAFLKERAAMSIDDERLPDITTEISRAIVKATHNRYYLLLFNSMARVIRISRSFFELPVFVPQSQTFFERLLEAFESRDHEMAALLAVRLFESNHDDMVGMLRFSMSDMDNNWLQG
jgi:GntR family transcriptional repressor for pyruvate dehydrogenase complex